MYWSDNKRVISRNGCHKLKLKKKKNHITKFKKQRKRERERDIAMPVFMPKSHSYIKKKVTKFQTSIRPHPAGHFVNFLATPRFLDIGGTKNIFQGLLKKLKLHKKILKKKLNI